MNVLVLTNNPHRPSFRQRVEIHLASLRRNGIDCEVAQFPVGVAARYRLLRRCADFDAVLLHKKRLNLVEAPLLRRFAGKIIYDFDDAVMYKARAPQRSSFSDWVRFHLTVKLADLVIAGNPYLAERARKFSANVEVLPTGLNMQDYKVPVEPRTDGKIRLVWIGSQSTLKYLAQIKPALEEIGSRFDNVVLRIIADDFFDLEKMPVEKRAWSGQSQAADLASSDIGLAPLPENRFTRGKCGFKILQYAAAGLPVIASPVGVNADYVRDKITGRLASGKQQWVDMLAELIGSPTSRSEMGRNSLEAVERFDAGVIGERLASLIHRCLGSIKS